MTLSACGGGGGGGVVGGGGSNETTTSYTGKTSQATLTIGNGEEISSAAYQNGSSNQAAGLNSVFASLNNANTTAAETKPKIYTLTKTLKGAINKIQPATNNISYSRAVVSESDSFPGECGGDANYDMTFDDVTGDFSGTFSFNRYCELGDTINGSFNMSGNINPDSLIFGTINISMSSLSVTSGNDSFTISGDISLAPDNNPSVVSMDIRLTDNTTGEVFWLENVTITITSNSLYEDVSMEGKFYHPDHGYSNITTPIAFQFIGMDEWPSSGVMVATGTNGSTATLTALSNTTYQIDIDENGDDALEQTTTGNWDSL